MPVHTPSLKLIECPRDAMQGWKHFIPTEKKAAYINTLLQVGFDTIDFGSFVSPKAIPQMADTAEVVKLLDKSSTATKLLAIVANLRGAEDAVQFDAINCLGFPFSISPTFQQLNTNSSIEASLQRVEEIQNLCIKNQKELVLYISMGFGNPYGDVYSEEIVLHWVDKIAAMDIRIISIADTVGVAQPVQVQRIMSNIIPAYTQVEFGVHLHSTPQHWEEKLTAAWKAGCRRFDGAMKGIGGCPMANNELVGNMNTELMVPYFQQLQTLTHFNTAAFEKSSRLAAEIFI
ncbi:MAG TPA: hydroxymethylglutaryl-CoA lyase [Ferruginibacter sp.]|nr:hydroxymethylglutaryl-CoA lyase [Ferruginibacter sp.]HMP20478.1 hydroxymethylglutaryl-CoA lyase [Ferruginibacter sp.]